MIVLHAGFDGLDLALRAIAPPELIEILEPAKTFAAEQMAEARVTYNDVTFNVAASGGTGGYAYRIDTGPMGATWFIKKPNAKDHWGIRVSFKSRPLALLGLEKVRADFEATCLKLGLRVPLGGVSIGRVDFAVDVLISRFELEPTDFVVHARTNRRSHSDLAEMTTNGPSGRYTSVTFGKMPGRQVIVYDKFEEVLKRNKFEWPMIWNSELSRLGLPLLDMSDRSNSTIWRIELRLGKKALRDRRNIRGWASLYNELQNEMDQLAEDVTLRRTSEDSNRSRWPLHPLWRVLKDAVSNGLFDHTESVAYEEVQEADLLQKRSEFIRTIAAHAVTLAVLERNEAGRFPDFLHEMPERIMQFILLHPRDLEQRVKDASAKYADFLE